jgi:hypothetical protein
MSGFVLKFGHYTVSFSANVAARSITRIGQRYFPVPNGVLSV